jgi:hypothetical protein
MANMVNRTIATIRVFFIHSSLLEYRKSYYYLICEMFFLSRDYCGEVETFPASCLLRCPEDAAEMTGFSSGGFGTSPRHLIEEGMG